MMSLQRPVSALALVALLAAGCGDVTVSGAFDGRQLHASGTVLAWLDETSYVDDVGGGTPLLTDRSPDAVVLHLRFTEAIFDPRVDLRTLPAGERQGILEDIARGDALALEIRRGGVVRPGDEIALLPGDGSLPPEVLPFISVLDVRLGEPVVTEGTRYPDRVARIGSDREAQLVPDETSPRLSGSLHIEARPLPDEGEGFLAGEVDIAFTTELLPERLAECNFAAADQGVADACNPS